METICDFSTMTADEIRALMSTAQDALEDREKEEEGNGLKDADEILDDPRLKTLGAIIRQYFYYKQIPMDRVLNISIKVSGSAQQELVLSENEGGELVISEGDTDILAMNCEVVCSDWAVKEEIQSMIEETDATVFIADDGYNYRQKEEIIRDSGIVPLLNELAQEYDADGQMLLDYGYDEAYEQCRNKGEE